MKNSTIYKLNFIRIVYSFFKKKQNSVRPTFAIVKKIIFLHEREFLFLILSFYHLICVSSKKTIYHKMQDEKLYSLQRTVYFNCVLFMLKNTPNSVRSVFATAKIGRTEFCFFLKTKKYTIQIKFSL